MGSVGLRTGAGCAGASGCMYGQQLTPKKNYTKYTICTTYYVSTGLEGSMKLVYSHCFF